MGAHRPERHVVQDFSIPDWVVIYDNDRVPPAVEGHRLAGGEARVWCFKGRGGIFHAGVSAALEWFDLGANEGFESPAEAVLAAIKRYERRFHTPCTCNDAADPTTQLLICSDKEYHFLNPSVFGTLSRLFTFQHDSESAWSWGLSWHDLSDIAMLESGQRMTLSDPWWDVIPQVRRAAAALGYSQTSDYLEHLTSFAVLDMPTYFAWPQMGGKSPSTRDVLRAIVRPTRPAPLEAFDPRLLWILRQWVVWDDHPIRMNYRGPCAWELAEALAPFAAKDGPDMQN